MKLYVCNEFQRPVRSHKEQHELGRKILSAMLDVREYEGMRPFAIAKDTYGKPFLEGHPEIQFNISHCPVCIAAVLSEKPVGIDVQQHFEWRESLAKHITSKQEWNWLLEKADIAERTNRLNRLWCRKESFLKCIGTGLRKDLGSICVLAENGVLHYGGESFRILEFQNDVYTMCICEKIK